MATLYLCGAGNSEGVRLALRVNEARPAWDRMVLLDDDPAKRGDRLLGVEVVGPFSALADADPAVDGVVNLVARTTTGRRRAGAAIGAYGVPWVGLVAPGVDTLGATLAPDVLVYPGAVLGPEIDVGAGSVVFMGAVVGHESRVGPGCVVAANAVLNARVELGEGVYVGANATVLPEIVVGAGATVGAGSSVVDRVAPGATVVGVPARDLGVAAAGGTAPGGTGSGGTAPGRARTPREVEVVLAAAWADVLGSPAPAPDAPVFEAGADSLSALRVAERVARETGLAVSVVDLFRYATIRALARHLTAGAGAGAGGAGAAREAGAPGAGGAPDVPPGPRSARAPGVPGGPADGDDTLVDTVTHAFRDALGQPGMGPDSHFFDRGGDPEAAQAVCRTLQLATGEPLCFMQVARYPTARELARHMAAAAGQPPTCPAQGVMTRLIHRHEWHRG